MDLEIDIEIAGERAPAQEEPFHHRLAPSTVRRPANQLHARLGTQCVLENAPGVVTAAVIDEDELYSNETSLIVSRSVPMLLSMCSASL